MNALTGTQAASIVGSGGKPSTGQHAPFFSSDVWLTPWQEIFCRPDDFITPSPAVFPEPDGSEARVYLPLIIRSERVSGIPLRVMRFMGTGDMEEEEVCTEFPDLWSDGIHPGFDISRIHTHLSSHFRWDLYYFNNILPDSLAATMMAGLRAFRQLAGWRYSVGLDQGFGNWVDQLSSNTRARVRRLLRLLDNEQIEFVWHDTPEGLREGLEALSRLHGSRWRSRGESGVFASRRFADYHRALISGPGSNAKIALLIRRGEVVSAWYGFDHAGTRYFYQSGFDPDCSDMSPGLAIHLLVIQDAFERGLHCYDFMKGGERSYKQHFATLRTPVFHYVAPGPTLIGRMLPSLLKRRSGWHAVKE